MKTKLVAWKFHREKLSSGCYIGHRLDLLCALAPWRFLNNYTVGIGCCPLWKPAVRNHTWNMAVSFISGLLSVCEYWHWEFLRLLLVSLISSALPVQSSVHWLVLLSCLILSNSHLTWLLPSSSRVCVSAISCGNLNLPSPNWCAWAQPGVSVIWSCVNHAIQGWDLKEQDVRLHTSLEVIERLMLWVNKLNHTVSDQDEIIQENSGRYN